MGDVSEKYFGELLFEGFRSDSGGRFSMMLGRSVGRSVGQVVGRSPLSPLAPKEVWSDIASSVCELSLVWRRLNMG